MVVLGEDGPDGGLGADVPLGVGLHDGSLGVKGMVGESVQDVGDGTRPSGAGPRGGGHDVRGGCGDEESGDVGVP